LAALQEYLSAIPAHHGTEKLRLQITKQISKVRQELQHGEKKGGHRPHGIKKIADLLVFLIGPPNSGKSEFLSAWTGVTTRKGMGIADLSGMKVQIVELPSVIPGIRGRAQPVMPDVVFVFITKEFPDYKALVEAYGIYMARVPTLVLSKDGLPGSVKIKSDFGQIESELIKLVGIKRIYLKSPQQKEPDKKPMIFRGDVNVGDVAALIHKSLAQNFKYARVWGSVNYQGEKVGKSYSLKDRDVVEIR